MGDFPKDLFQFFFATAIESGTKAGKTWKEGLFVWCFLLAIVIIIYLIIRIFI